MLTVHRSERADALVRELAVLLSTTPADPFTPDLVAVPSRGVERWIAQSLSARLGTADGRADGICANVEFPSPHRLVGESLASATGIDPAGDPWAEHRLAWTLLAVIDACAGEPWCATLGRHVGATDGRDRGRRVAVSQKLARLFTTYASQRPAMILDWARGDDTDGHGAPLDGDLVWQAELWRRLRTTVGNRSPAERLDDACTALRDDPARADLPDRVSLFGPTRLTTEQLRVLDALGARRDVHLWLAHPSHGLWNRLDGTTSGGSPRRSDPTLAVPRHPLVASMARDARELQLRLADELTATTDTHTPAAPPPATLLGTLQRDLHEDRTPDDTYALDPSDRTIQVHACHGRQRQVEVLRETLLGILDDDPTLEPRDIVVMCPDIESWAPLITAAFGLADDEDDDIHPGHRLRVRLADRSLRQTNAVLSVVARVLELADGRLTASDLLDLAAMPPVRRRFGFGEDALERLGDWVRDSGVRWGLDVGGRAPYGLESVRQNTWRAGLDRILVGAAKDGEDLAPLGLALPLDDVDSGDIDLAGRLAEYVDRVATVVGRLGGEHRLESWVDTLVEVTDALCDTSYDEQWQPAHARRRLTDVLASVGDRADTIPLGLADVRAVLADRLEGRPTRANFRTGNLTMCTMVPMRSVPHRVVCLLGLDDQAFPRSSRLDGDDVLARTPRVGERDPRAEDRQLFLDAVLAAEDRLVVVYTGADERTGAIRPPSVPVGELLDALDRTAHLPGVAVRDQVLVRHPLQPFDARNFEPGRLGDDGPFSFDTASYDGALAARHQRTARGAFLDTPLVDVGPPEVVEIDDLIRFLEHPVKAFLSQRLGVASLWDEEPPADALPVEVDGLEKWGIGDRMLSARLRGIPSDTAVTAAWLRGRLPPGALGRTVLDPIVTNVEALVAATGSLRRGSPRTVDVDVTLPSGVRLAGAAGGLYDHDLVRVTYSRLGPKHRLRAWVQYLALAAAHPDERWMATTVGRAGKVGTSTSCITGQDADQARARLDDLVALMRAGLCAPLPLVAATSAAYAERRDLGEIPVEAADGAAKEWRRTFNGREIGDYEDRSHQRVWGDASFAAVRAEGRDPEAGWPEEPHRFGQLARRVWQPILDLEEVSTL